MRITHIGPGQPCWFDLTTPDPDSAAGFYGKVFGWQTATAMPGYAFLRNGNGTVAGLGAPEPGQPEAPAAWMAYFLVDGLEATMAKTRELGGAVLTGPFEVAPHGRLAVLADPAGAAFAIWQSTSDSQGDFVMFEDHAVGWVELATRDCAAARAFYGALFGWTFDESPIPLPGGMTYTHLGLAGKQFGGILPMTAEWGEMPAHWSLYVPVPDVDAALDRCREAGGQVTVPAFEAEGVGRIARIADPTGAGLYLIRLSAPKG